MTFQFLAFLDPYLPLVFLVLMGFSMLMYVMLDGYDLGVGMWLLSGSQHEKDIMIGSIGPFWDANETWLVLGVGILLIAFPAAHGMVLTALYIPVTCMLIGLILRGVAFDFRAKAPAPQLRLWNLVFMLGSTLAAVSQGWMLGRYITGFAETPAATVFAVLIALALPAAYGLLGACWLIMKTEGALQEKALRWARIMLPPVVVGIALISLATPLASPTVFERWFTLPAFLYLLPIPLLTLLTLSLLAWNFWRNPNLLEKQPSRPFYLVLVLFLLAALGLAYSIVPYVVIDRLLAVDAASSPEALRVILLGTLFSVPAILGYTFFTYRVFRGKAQPLSYG